MYQINLDKFLPSLDLPQPFVHRKNNKSIVYIYVFKLNKITVKCIIIKDDVDSMVIWKEISLVINKE